ncbi:MAG: glycosyltransferase, partial [Patescibacteria group bacterium]
MKILIITNSVEPTSGWGRYSQEILTGLVKQGHEVFLVCAKKSANDINPQTSRINVLPSPLSDKKNFWLCFYYAWLIKKQVNLAAIDAIHCLVESYAPIASFLSGISGRPYFLTAHGTFGVKFFKNC